MDGPGGLQRSCSFRLTGKLDCLCSSFPAKVKNSVITVSRLCFVKSRCLSASPYTLAGKDDCLHLFQCAWQERLEPGVAASFCGEDKNSDIQTRDVLLSFESSRT